MRKLLTWSLTALALFELVPGALVTPAHAERVIVKKTTVIEGKDHRRQEMHHRHKVGHHFEKRDVLMIDNWRARGLPQPRRGEVYVVEGGDIYLATAATLIVKALID